MGRLFPVVLSLLFVQGTILLAADEGRAPKQAVEALLGRLADDDPQKVRAALKAIGKIGPAKDVTLALAKPLKSPKERVRWAAAEALSKREHDAADLVPVYAELLTARAADIRAASAWRLGRLGGDAKPAVALLAAALRDENLEVRVQVGQALANLGRWAKPALPALVRALGDRRLDEPSQADKKPEDVRKSPALPALVSLSDQAIPLLIETFSSTVVERKEDLFGEDGSEVAQRVAHAFPAFGGQAVAPLLRALGAKDANTRLYAAISLRELARFDGLPDDAVEKLEKRLDGSDKEMRLHAVLAISWVRPANTKIGTILIQADQDSGGGLLDHLERLIPHNPKFLDHLFRLLGSDDARVSREAHRILGELELPADRVLGAWTKALSHTDSKVRYEAITELTRLGPSAKTSKAKLLDRFPEESDSYNKGGILDALTAIAPADPALLPLLIESLDDRESWVRWRALGCLETLGPKAKYALPTLESRLAKPAANGPTRRSNREVRRSSSPGTRAARDATGSPPALARTTAGGERPAIPDGSRLLVGTLRRTEQVDRSDPERRAARSQARAAVCGRSVVATTRD